MECLVRCIEENKVMGLGLGQKGGLDTKGNGMCGLDIEGLVGKAQSGVGHHNGRPVGDQLREKGKHDWVQDLGLSLWAN